MIIFIYILVCLLLVLEELLSFIFPIKTNYYLSDYSVGQFFEDARQATRCILDKGRVPIVVGGTGLYLRWYVFFNYLF